MATAAPLASHFSCWRRSPDERRQLSAWRPMKASENGKSITKIECSTTANQPVGSSTAERPPVALPPFAIPPTRGLRADP
jgi:hypothetical protein